MKVHFLGIGGSGASACAAIAQAYGYEVTGCDLEPHNEFTTQFKDSQLFKNHNPEHLYCHPESDVTSDEGSLANASQNKSGDSSLITQNDKLVDILAVTPAIFSLDPQNPELVSAKEKGIPIVTWQQFLGRNLAKNKLVIAVCGTHGKTTTTAMIAKMLEDAGLDPTVELGAIVPWWKRNFRVGKSQYFVVEADEYNDNFLALTPDISVVTNIEMDHPEYFKDFEAVKRSFRKFLESTRQTIVANLKDPGVKQTLGFNPRGWKQIIDYSKYLIDFSLQIPGDFNRWNASAAYQVGLTLRLDPQAIQKSLATYPGIGRRFEYIGKFHGAEVYSDFGHHPTEIKVTMKAAREKFPKSRILLVYQPHMFTRTKALFDDFVRIFRKIPANKTFIMDIYPSREVDTNLVTSKQLVEAINTEAVEYIGSTGETLDKLKPQIKRGDVAFFMSAGDTDKLAKQLVQKALNSEQSEESRFRDKRVLIFGLGLNQGGVGSAKFFAKQGAEVRVTDLKSAKILKPSLDELKQFPQIKYILGQHRKEDIDWADLIIKNPAVKPGNPYMEYATTRGKEIEMDIGIFLKFVKPSQIIGVTGTKGKSTTASLLYEVLKSFTHEAVRKSAGVNTNPPQGWTFTNVVLAGNIGKSVLDTILHVTLDTLVVLEISSFQLKAFDQHKTSPRWAIITNITPDHLNYHQTMDEYIAAKKIVGKYQTKNDFLFIRKGDPVIDKKSFLKGLHARIIRFSKNDLPKNFHPHLLGEHNLENMAATLALARTFGVSDKITLKVLSQFNSIPFRMELVKTWRGFKIYNDSTATNPSATIQALKALGPKSENQQSNIILIVGGMNKNMDYKELAYTIDLNVKAVYFLEGDAVDDIICEMHEKETIEGRFDNLEKLLSKLKNDISTNPYFKKGDSMLFSPAATSFNLFQNEFDRGRKFNTAVEKVFGKGIS